MGMVYRSSFEQVTRHAGHFLEKFRHRYYSGEITTKAKHCHFHIAEHRFRADDDIIFRFSYFRRFSHTLSFLSRTLQKERVYRLNRHYFLFHFISELKLSQQPYHYYH